MGKRTKIRKRIRGRYTDENGISRSRYFRSNKDMECWLRKKRVEVDEIKDGTRKPSLPVRTCDELFDYCLTYHTPHKKDAKNDESIIRVHLRPEFGKIRIDAINQEHVDRYIAKREHLSKKTLHNHVTLFISTLNIAFRIGWLDRVPPIKKPKISHLMFDYKYLQTTDEIRRLLLAAKEEDDDDRPQKYKFHYPFYATAAYSGMRAGELAGLRWSDVNFETRLITVQRSYKTSTKSNKVRYVPILDTLMPILKEWRLKSGHSLVFTNHEGNMIAPSDRIFQETFHRILERAGLPKMRFHDLRHTFASHWVMNGGDLYKLQKILGHSSITVTERYAHLSPQAYVNDYSRLGQCLPVTGGDVVEIEKFKQVKGER